MAYFHYRCGERITLLNDNCTAVRNDGDFDNGLVITAEPLQSDVLFEIKIDRKVNSWSGSIEIGLIDTDPLHFDFPACSSKIHAASWIMSGTSFYRNGNIVIEGYGLDLEKLSQDDRVGLMRTAEADLIFYINGESQGVAAENVPNNLYAVVDVYGKCVQVTITSPALREHNNDDCLSGSSVLAIDNDILNVTLGGDLSELSMSSSNSLDIRMDINVSLSLPEESARVDRLRFHDRCGSLVKLSNNNRTAERRRPLDEFNNGVVMTHRPLRDGELFEIRIDRLVEKWSGSIEMGITTHNPNTLVFPATMTNMRSGTIMMSGCGILTNGKGTRREYGDFNLDELSEGDRVGMMRKIDGNLHYFINGLDQGVAAELVPSIVWGVIDLYGMTIKVSIVERDEREEQNLMTRKNTREQQQLAIVETTSQQSALPDYYDRLTFHPNCGTHAQVVNNGRTAHRPNAVDDFNNGVVLTRRPLKTGELFQVRLDRIVTKWAGSIEIGVTTHTPVDLEFPFTMTNVRSGTWMMTGSGIMHNGTIVLEQYGINLDRLQVGDRVGVVRKENGYLHFFVNGVDQGAAASNIPEEVYGVIDLYGQAVEATIVDMYDNGSPDTVNSSLSNTTLYSDLRFHHIHGKNARIVNGGLTAIRPRPFTEFNDAIVFSSRPLRDGELFEVCLDNVVDRWSGSIELGVTAVRPDDIELPSTATDLTCDTWMLSGSSVMENGTTIKTNYPCDLDGLGSGIRVGVVRSADRTLEFYRDGIPQGTACIVPHSQVYAVVDLYGQCAQVSIPCVSPLTQMSTSANVLDSNCPRSETCLSLAAQQASVRAAAERVADNIVSQSMPAAVQNDLYFFGESSCKDIMFSDDFRVAKRIKDPAASAIVSSAVCLVPDELYEITIVSLVGHLAGSLVIGLSNIVPAVFNSTTLFNFHYYLIDNELKYQNKTVQLFTPSLNWLNVGDRIGFLRTNDNNVKVFINSEDISVVIPASQPDALMFIVIDLRGACNSVAITNRKLLMSPMMGRLQDSLELVLQPEEDVSLNSQVNENENNGLSSGGDGECVSYEFSENHGRNIELIDGRMRARRVASYNQGLVVMQPALEFNGKVQIVMEEIDMKWQSSLMVGIVVGPPDRMTLPMNLLAFKPPCCILANDWISINGVKSRSSYGQKLAGLIVGDVVSVQLTACGVALAVNGVEEEMVTWVPPNAQPLYAVFDLYGQCQQIQIVNSVNEELAASSASSTSTTTSNNVDKLVNDCEKADLENCEKERLTLSIPSTASCSSMSPSNHNNVSKSPQSPHFKSLPCSYKDECIQFRHQLHLPDQYFQIEDDESSVCCFCANCYKIKSQCGEKDSSLLDWVRFPLKQIGNQSTDKWHTAFYPAKIGAVRCILDKGQPLTKGQSQWGNLVIQQEDDLQVVFYPSVQKMANFSFQLKNNKKVYAAFQLLIKPNAYSVSRDTQEWCTKETGAIALHSLLIHISN